MKKKGFSLKRAVSLLLAAAMIVTAAPQTSLTALAAEPGAALENPDVSEDLEVVTVEDGTDEDGDIGDNGTVMPSDGVDGTEDGSGEQPADPDGADQSENVGGGTQDPVDPDDTNQDDETEGTDPSEDADQSGDTDPSEDAEQSDEGEDVGESDETAEPEEGVDDETAEGDETETEVETGKKYLAEGSGVVPKPGYIGEYYSEPDSENDGVTRDILEIEETKATEAKTTVTAILAYYCARAREEEQVEEEEEDLKSVPKRFDEVRLNLNTTSSIDSPQTIEADYVNAARDILKDGGSINYSIHSDSSNAGVSYNLQQPHEMGEGDYSVKFTAAPESHWGVIVSLDKTDFPADGIYINYMWHDTEADQAAECFWTNGDGAELGIFAWDGSVPTGALGISKNGIDCDDKSEDQENYFLIGFSLNEAIYSQSGVALEPDKKYLFACVKNDANISMSETGTQVEVGKHAGESVSISNVDATSLNDDILKVVAGNNNTVTLTAVGVGTTYYYVTYTVSGTTYSEIHKVTTNQQTEDGKVLNYVGDVSTQSDDEGDYTVLRIDESACEANTGYDEDDSIPDILRYHNDKGHKFNYIEFNTYVDDVKSPVTLKRDYINGAIDILDNEDEEKGRYWLGYVFQQEEPADEQSDTYPHIKVSYNMWHPGRIENDIQVTLNVESKPDQGVLFNLSNTDFQAEGFNFSYRVEARDRSDISECLGGTEGEYAILSWDNGTLTRLVESNWISLYEEEYDNNGTVYVSDISVDLSEEMEKGKDYLITPLYRDENVQVGGGQTLKAGLRSDSENIKDVKWTVLSQDLISIEPGDGIEATLTANGMGEAYYYVTYVSDSEDKNYLELHAVRSVVGAGLSYLGEINDKETTWNEDDEEVPYRRLMINEWEAKDKNGEDSTIADILAYYAEQIEAGAEERFNCVQLDMMDFSSRMQADDINGAISVMDWNKEKLAPWMDYNYWDNDTQLGVNYSLFGLRGVEGDTSIDATFAVELMPHQGVKVMTATAAADFPAEQVSVSINKEKKDAFADCFELEPVESEESDRRTDHLRLMALEDGVVPSVIEPRDMWVDEYDFRDDEGNTIYGSNFGLSLKGLEAGRAYLITPIYYDEESVPMGETGEIHAGLRSGNNEVSGVTWKSLNEDLITITPGTGAVATLTAGRSNFGTAYYSAEYKSGENTYLELHSMEVTFAAFSDELAYLGEVVRDAFEDGTTYLRLRIDEREAKNKDADITDILKFYEDMGMKFNCIEFNMSDASLGTTANNFSIKLKKEYMNGALSIMNWDNGDIEPWMDYNFWNDDTRTGVNFTLSSLRETKTDAGVDFTVSELVNQGLKVKFTSKNFPADYVSMGYDQPGNLPNDSWITGKSFRLFTHSSGTPTAMVSTDREQGWGYYDADGEGDDAWTNIYFNNIVPLGTTEYLATSVYWDEDDLRPVVGGNAVQLTPGKRAGVTTGLSSVTWKSFDTDKATIDKDGKMTAWSADGEIYYYVTYKVGSEQYLEVHETYAQNPPIEKLEFDQDEITLNYYPEGDGYPAPDEEWLQLRYYPGNVDRNISRIRWEIDPADRNVISFISDDGGIRAEGEGTVTVRAHYLDGDYPDGGDFVPSDPENVLATAECTVKVIQPLTRNEMQGEVDSLNDRLYALMGVDARLSDVEFPEEFPGWTWKEPGTVLADYQGMDDGYSFAATYTRDEDHTFECRLWVRFVTPTGITMMAKNEIQEWLDGWALQNGKTITLGYQYEFNSISQYSDNEYEVAQYNKFTDKLNTKYAANIVWTTTPANKGTTNADKTFTFTADSSKTSEKQTVTVSVKDGSKVLFKDTRTIIVTQDEPYDMSYEAVQGPYLEKDENDKLWLVLKVWMPEDEYKTKELTVVSEDTSILKPNMKGRVLKSDKEIRGDEEGNPEDVTYVWIPFTQPKIEFGTAWIKITAPDGITRRDCVEFIDRAPKVMSGTTISLNKQSDTPETVVTVRTHYDYTIIGTPVLKLDGNTTDGLRIKEMNGPERDFREWDEDNEYKHYNVYDITIAMTDAGRKGIKKGKHTVTLDFDIRIKEPGQESGETEHCQLKLTLNVTDAKPKVTFKQTKKFNNFYTDEEANGILTVNSNGVEVKDLKLVDGSAACNFEVQQIPIWGPKLDDEGNEVQDENGDTVYDIVAYEENRYYVVLKGTDATKNKKGVLTYRLEGFSEPFTTNFTVAVENKKPTLVLSQKSDTLYPEVGYKESWLWISDKSTWEGLNIDGIEVKVKDKNGALTRVDVRNLEDWWRGPDYNYAEGEATKAGGNNPYYLAVAEDGTIIVWLQPGETYKNKTDKLNLTIKEKNWSSPVSVSYSMKVDTAAKPKLVLGKSTLTLNNDSALYRTQQERTTLRLKGCAFAPAENDGWNRVSFVGTDNPSREVLTKGHLTLEYWNNEYGYGEVIARINDNSGLAAGKTYKFKVNVSVGDNTYASTTLKVKVVGKSADKCLKVTAKGSINLMDREGTYITYTPKLSNLSGTVSDARLEGKDADMFQADWDEETGKLIVRAQRYTTYSTKMTYQVQAVFFVQPPNYTGYEVRTDAAKPLKIKVKQGKPKLKATMANNTIYRQLDNSVDIKLSAVFNKKDVEIERAELLNYTGDFQLEWAERTRLEPDGNVSQFWSSYDPQTGSVKLMLNDRHYAESVVKNGKTWKVKLAVIYREKAGNEKAAQVTCSIVVR